MESEMGSEKKKTMKGFAKIAFFVCHFLVTGVILGLTASMFTNMNQSQDRNSYVDAPPKARCGDSLLKTYPNQFRTKTAQKKLNSSIGDTLTRTYHGCCTTKTVFYSPDTVKCIVNGVEQTEDVTVAAFDDYKQYFSRDECRLIENCIDTKCSCEDAYFTVVYVDNPDKNIDCDEKYKICTFKTEGCCKCTDAKI